MASPRLKASMLRKVFPLRYDADWRTIFFLAIFILLAAMQWIGSLRYWTISLLTCLLAFIACVIKHNHIHCRTFASRRWNRLFDYTLSLCTGQPITAIISIHNERHHSDYHSERDCVRSSLVKFRSNILNVATFAFAAVRAVHQNKHNDLARWRRDKPQLYRRLLRERVVVIGAIVALLIADWRSTLLYLGVPWIFGQWGIVTINLIQHQNCDHGSAHNHSRNLTGRVLNWLFLNNGYHTAHHQRPALHWSFLREYHKRLVVPNIRADLNEPALVSFLWRYLTRRNA